MRRCRSSVRSLTPLADDLATRHALPSLNRRTSSIRTVSDISSSAATGSIMHCHIGGWTHRSGSEGDAKARPGGGALALWGSLQSSQKVWLKVKEPLLRGG